MASSTISPQIPEDKQELEAKGLIDRFYARKHRSKLPAHITPNLEYNLEAKGALLTAIDSLTSQVLKLQVPATESDKIKSSIQQVQDNYQTYFSDIASGLPSNRKNLDDSISALKKQIEGVQKTFEDDKRRLEEKKGELKAQENAVKEAKKDFKEQELKAFDEVKKAMVERDEIQKKIEEQKKLEAKTDPLLDEDKSKLQSLKNEKLGEKLAQAKEKIKPPEMQATVEEENKLDAIKADVQKMEAALKVKTDPLTEFDKKISELETAQKTEFVQFKRSIDAQFDQKRGELLSMEALEARDAHEWKAKDRFWRDTSKRDQFDEKIDPSDALAELKVQDIKIKQIKPPGVFERDPPHGIKLYVTEEGYGDEKKIKICPSRKGKGAKFVDAFKEVIKFIKGGLWQEAATLDYTNHSFVKMDEVREFLRLAEEANVNVELGPAVIEKLKRIGPPQEDEILNKMKKIQENHLKESRKAEAKAATASATEAKWKADEKEISALAAKYPTGGRLDEDKTYELKSVLAQPADINDPDADYDKRLEDALKHQRTYLQDKIIFKDMKDDKVIIEHAVAEIDKYVARYNDLQEVHKKVKEQIQEIQGLISQEQSPEKLKQYEERLNVLEKMRREAPKEYKDILTRQEAVLGKLEELNKKVPSAVTDAVLAGHKAKIEPVQKNAEPLASELEAGKDIEKAIKNVKGKVEEKRGELEAAERKRSLR